MAFIISNIIPTNLPHSLRSTSFLSPRTLPQSIRTSRSYPANLPTPLLPNVSMQIVEIKKHDVFMPALSSTMTEGRVVQWLKQLGDEIQIGEPIMVVESDKADMDVEAFEEGYLATILIEEGESCGVGETVAIIVENKDDIAKIASATPAAAAAKPAASAATPTPIETPAVVAPAAGGPEPDYGEVFMPALSSTMTEGKVVEWLKEEGDAISSGENIMVVESDKADMDVEAFEDGFLAYISVDAGDSCPVGDPVAYLAHSEADIPIVNTWAKAQSSDAAVPMPDSVDTPAAKPVVEKAVPVESKSTGGGVVINEGRIVSSPRAKVVAKELGVDLKFVQGTGPGGRIAEKDVVKAKEGGVGVVGAGVDEATAVAVLPVGKMVATPEAKKMAKKEKIDLATVVGTGKFGRITANDVLKAAGKMPEPEVAAAKNVVVEAAPMKEKAKPVEMRAGAVAMNAMQKAVVQNMSASLSVPAFRVTYRIKTTALDELYAKVKPKGVTMSALLAKAVAITLTKHPIMNAQYADNSILYRPDVHVAMAVALKDGGLITPTLKNADKTDLYSMSRQWKDLVRRAMEKKLSPDEYSSGTFFVSNLGMFGVEQFDAILPPGAPGILAIGASKPVVGLQKNGLVGVEKEMNVTLTADHRHIYGADGARFLKDLTELIENDVMELLM